MEFQVLGPLEVLDENGTRIDVGPKQQRALLALLLLNANRVVATERIIETLWPDEPQGKEKTLWVYVSRLRNALEPGREANTKSTLLATRDHGYSLNIESAQIDSFRFESTAAEAGSRVRLDPKRALDGLDSALSLWRGDAYEDFTYDDFAQAEINRLEQSHVVATEDRIDAAIRLGHHREVLGELEGLVAASPLRERPVELLMVALYRSGRQADALRAYQRHRRLVGEELGIEPSPELRRIEEQVLLHDPRLQPATPSITAGLAPEVANPFKGLLPFAESDAATFFGRDRLVSDIVRRLVDNASLVSLVGASGSGKSSVLKAGLIPTVRKGAIGSAERWAIAQMVPGTRPFTELEAALLRSTLDSPDSLGEQLGSGDDGLLRAAFRILPEDGGRLLLVIDQFEELFTLVESEPDRGRFIRNLELAAADPHNRVVIVIALRADFYDRPLAYGTFASLLGESVINVVPLTPDELEAAAERPAAVAGVNLEPSLLGRLLSDVAGQSGGLPLFQYALTELFDRRSGSVLTSEAYVEMGGVRGAIARRAEELFVGLSQPEQAACKQLFLRLVTIAEAGAWSRRRVAASEIVTITDDVVDLKSVLDKFAVYRLLTFDRDYVSGSPTVEVAHEALLREWPRLEKWIDQGRGDVLRHARFLTALGEWRASEKSADYLLSGQRLVDYESWAVSSTLRLSAKEHDFLEASIARRQEDEVVEAARIARETKLDRQARRRLRGLAVGAAVLATLVFGILFAAFAGNKPRIVAVHGVTGDFGVNDLMLAGTASAEDQFELEIERREPLIDPIGDLEELAETGADLIVVSSDFDVAVQVVAPQYPDVHFVALDPTLIKVPAPNITEMHFAVEDSGFLAGVTAALASETGSVGFIGGFQTLATERSRVGFERGARFDSDTVRVDSRYLGPLDTPWVKGNTSPDLAYDLASEMYESGIDVIFHDAGESSEGIIEAARDLSTDDRHLWVIGSEVDQGQTTRSAIGRSHVLASAIKRYDAAIVKSVRGFLDGELPAGNIVLGLGEAGVGLSQTGDHLTAMGIGGHIKNIEGEMSIDHIPFEPFAQAEPAWQHQAEVVIWMEMGSEFCKVIAVEGAEAVNGDLRVPRGTKVTAYLNSVTDEVAGIGFRTVEHSVTLDQLEQEALVAIPQAFGEALAISVIAPQASSAVSAVMDGTAFVPNCFLFEPDRHPSDFLPLIVRPSS